MRVAYNMTRMTGSDCAAMLCNSINTRTEDKHIHARERKEEQEQGVEGGHMVLITREPSKVLYSSV